jgi:hypothetical protein
VTLTVFCPNSHLSLDAPVCPICGWKRPETGALGELAWEHPLELDAELGGPGRHVFARLAAARGTDGRKYPWGDSKPSELLCNFDGLLGETSQVSDYSPQGDSPYGCADMAGNVCEWTNSLWGEADERPDYTYLYTAEDGREDKLSEGHRVHRGGSWTDDADGICSAYRDWDSPKTKENYLGFRCACRNVSS